MSKRDGAVESASTFARFLKFDPATLYEAAGQEGNVDPGIRPAWTGAKVCGRALTVQCPPGDNLMLHIAVAEAEADDVIVASASAYLFAGAWGEILTVAALSRGVAGLVIDGAVRDIVAIEALGFPVFSRGHAIAACTKGRAGKLNVPIQLGGVTVCPGDLILGDGDGLVVVESQRLDDVYLAALERRSNEAEIVRRLKRGETTIELLGLPDVRSRSGGGGGF